MIPRLKVCCIGSVEEAQLAVSLGADALGLVGAMPSGPGPIDDKLIRRIVRQAPPPVATFLLTSRTDAAGVVDHVRRCAVNTVQLVDTPDRGVYDAIRDELPSIRIVQVIHVQGDEAIEEACACAGHVDALLLDSGRPCAEVRELGGTGRTHDWSISARIVERVDRPVFLAGGLNNSNVREAVGQVRPFGVDLCGGVRTEGRLDTDKLRCFVAALWGAPSM